MSPFERLLADLSEGGVLFVTVGGVACAFNGHVRATQDVDILVDTNPDNLELMLKVLVRFGEGHAEELGVEDFPLEPGAVRIVEDFPLDIFTQLVGMSYKDIENHIRWWRGGEVPIPFLDAAGLILLKRGSVRERDRIDVEVLTGIAESGG